MADPSSSLSPDFLQSMEEPLPGGMLGAGSLSGLSGLVGCDPRPEDLVPYLDVMTVSSAAITSKSGAKTQYGSHTRMFSEPISIPSLRHTGLSTSLLDSGPAHSKLELFYSNGTKKFNLRDTIKEKLEQSKRGPGMPGGGGGGDSSMLFGDGLGGTASTLGQSASAASLLSSLGTSGVPLGLAHQAPALGSLDMSAVSSVGRGPVSGGGPQSRRRKGGGGRRRQRGGKLQAMSAGRPSPMLSSMADRSMGGGGGPSSESRRAQLGQSRGSFLSNIHTRPRDAQTKLVLAKLRHTVNRLEAQSAIIVRGSERERERERERESESERERCGSDRTRER